MLTKSPPDKDINGNKDPNGALFGFIDFSYWKSTFPKTNIITVDGRNPAPVDR